MVVGAQNAMWHHDSRREVYLCRVGEIFSSGSVLSVRALSPFSRCAVDCFSELRGSAAIMMNVSAF